MSISTFKPRAFVMLLAAIFLALALASASSAQSSPDGAGWWTSPSIQNVSSTDNATIVFTAYWDTDSADASTYSGSAILAPGSSVIYNPGLSSNCESPPVVAANGCRLGVSPSLPAGFGGSVVVSSDSPVASFVSLKNNPVGSVGANGGAARASYEGVGGTAAANLLYFPSFKNDFAGQSTIFYVQAAGADTNVRLTYTALDATTYTEDKTILANRTYAFIPSAASVPSCNGGVNATCRGGATLEVLSGGDVVGTAVEYEEGASVAEFVLASAAITPADTDTKILIPSAKDNFNGQTTGIAIFNTTGTEAIADLTYTVKGVQGCSSVTVGDIERNQVAIPANSSTVVRTTANNTPFPSECGVFYSVVVEDVGGDQNLAATVNQSENRNGQSLKTKYNAFAASQATNTVIFPLVKESFANGITGVSLVNAGDVATTVTVTYSGAGDHVLQTLSMDSGESITLRLVANGDTDIASVLSGGLPATSSKYAVTAVADAVGATIVGIAQEASSGDTLLDIQNYGGINQ